MDNLAILWADEADTLQSADFLGKKSVIKRSWGSIAGKRNVTYSETEEHRIKPHLLRTLRDHECILVHCERGHRRARLRPILGDGLGQFRAQVRRGWLASPLRRGQMR